MTFLVVFSVVFVAAVSASSRDFDVDELSDRGLFDFLLDTGGPEWNGLRVTFGITKTPSHLPRTVQEATSEGWRHDKACDYAANGFYGHRFTKDGDVGAMLLFDDAGFIAGIQAGITKGGDYPSGNTKKSFVDVEADKYTMSAYFTDTGKICKGGRSQAQFDAQGTGDRLIIQDGKSLMNIPLVQSAARVPWTEGKCFYLMGKHYWYDMTDVDMKCSDTKPLFLLYNNGILNAFGWAFFHDLPSKRFEHPPYFTFQGFMKTVPHCLETIGIISTMHIYLTDDPYWTNYC